MSIQTLTRRHLVIAAPAVLLGACAGNPPATTAASPPAAEAPESLAQVVPGGVVARVEIVQTQVSFIGNVAWGSGTLLYQGRRYPFRMRGLGIGGFGVARLTAEGDVYGMRQLSDFSGLFGLLRAGLVAGEAELRGGLWLRNRAGVAMNLRPQRQGLALQVGADGILVEMQE